MPDAVPDIGSVEEIDCTGALSLQVTQDSKCDPPPKNSRTLPPCMPLVGQFVVSGGIDETPKELTISLARDGISLFSRTVKPSYEQMRPNGPDCEPVCNRGEESLTF
jgi:hypothetical protein